MTLLGSRPSSSPNLPDSDPEIEWYRRRSRTDFAGCHLSELDLSPEDRVAVLEFEFIYRQGRTRLVQPQHLGCLFAYHANQCVPALFHGFGIAELRLDDSHLRLCA